MPILTKSLLALLLTAACITTTSCRHSNTSAVETVDSAQVQKATAQQPSSASEVKQEAPQVVPQAEPGTLTREKFLATAKQIADWYYDNRLPYAADNVMYTEPECPFSANKACRHDCSGFTTLIMYSCGIVTARENFSSVDFISENTVCGKALKTAGFETIHGEFPQEDFDKFQPGDILAVNQGPNGKEHHVTIYAGNGRFYDYGGKAPGHKQPISGKVDDLEMNPHTYTIIWRLKK